MRETVAHYIKEGVYDYLLRIHCSVPHTHYKQFYLSKRDGWDLDDVKLYRNKLCQLYEDTGIRASGNKKKGGRIRACDLGMN